MKKIILGLLVMSKLSFAMSVKPNQVLQPTYQFTSNDLITASDCTYQKFYDPNNPEIYNGNPTFYCSKTKRPNLLTLKVC